MKQAIINATIFTGASILKNKVIIAEDAVITAVSDTIPGDIHIIDLKGKNISAGLIDIQINGGKDLYFSQHPNEQALNDISKACHQYGTLSFLPTLISSPLTTIIEAIEAVKSFMEEYPGKGVIGMHLEGPYFNLAKRGAHNKGIVRSPADKELEQIVAHGRGVIKVMTIAPEVFTDHQIRFLQENDILLSAGHSDMTYQQAQSYFAKGIKLTTHLYNAMSPFTHRAPGMAGAILDNEDVYASLILDGHHCDYAAARIAYRLKKEKLFLITDSTFLGRNKTSFEWNSFDAILQDGTYHNKEGHLAGAAISMIEAVKNARKHLHISLQEAIAMATSRVAKAIRMEDRIGSLMPGYPARFFVFDDEINDYSTIIL